MKPRPISNIGFGAIFVSSLLCSGISTSAAEATERRHVVAVNNYVDGDYKGDYETPEYRAPSVPLAIWIILANEETKRSAELLPKKYRLLQSNLQGFDMSSLLRDSLRCLPADNGEDVCEDPTIVEADNERFIDALPPDESAFAAVKINIEYRNQPIQPKGFILTYVYAEGKGAPSSLDRTYTFTYFEPAPPETMGDPFASATQPPEKTQDAEARTYWLSGTPSRFETLFRRSVKEFLISTRQLHAHLAASTHDPSKEGWWNALPRLRELKEQKIIGCAGHECKRPYLLWDSDRLIYLPESMPQRIFVSSVPLSSFRRP